MTRVRDQEKIVQSKTGVIGESRLSELECKESPGLCEGQLENAFNQKID